LTVVITGATSGIGEELAKLYLKNNYTVVALGRNSAKLAELKYYAVSCGSNCETFDIDLRNFQELQNISKQIVAMFGSIDLVIANAGISAPHSTELPSFEDFKNIIDTNFLSVHALLEPIIPFMKSGSKIALISSLAGYVPLPTALAYASSKAALNFYSDSLRNILKPRNINVISIRPGFIDTPLTKKNKFKMPFLMKKEDAAKNIVNAIEKSKNIYAFPFCFAFLVKGFALLPNKLRDYLISKLNSRYDSRY
jgi:short-subunit dehydrogenase